MRMPVLILVRTGYHRRLPGFADRFAFLREAQGLLPQAWMPTCSQMSPLCPVQPSSRANWDALEGGGALAWTMRVQGQPPGGFGSLS